MDKNYSRLTENHINKATVESYVKRGKIIVNSIPYPMKISFKSEEKK